jgi:hypothetical protein
MHTVSPMEKGEKGDNQAHFMGYRDMDAEEFSEKEKEPNLQHPSREHRRPDGKLTYSEGGMKRFARASGNRCPVGGQRLADQ